MRAFSVFEKIKLTISSSFSQSSSSLSHGSISPTSTPVRLDLSPSLPPSLPPLALLPSLDKSRFPISKRPTDSSTLSSSFNCYFTDYKLIPQTLPDPLPSNYLAQKPVLVKALRDLAASHAVSAVALTGVMLMQVSLLALGLVGGWKSGLSLEKEGAKEGRGGRVELAVSRVSSRRGLSSSMLALGHYSLDQHLLPTCGEPSISVGIQNPTVAKAPFHVVPLSALLSNPASATSSLPVSTTDSSSPSPFTLPVRPLLRSPPRLHRHARRIPPLRRLPSRPTYPPNQFRPERGRPSFASYSHFRGYLLSSRTGGVGSYQPC